MQGERTYSSHESEEFFFQGDNVGVSELSTVGIPGFNKTTRMKGDC